MQKFSCRGAYQMTRETMGELQWFKLLELGCSIFSRWRCDLMICDLVLNGGGTVVVYCTAALRILYPLAAILWYSRLGVVDLGSKWRNSKIVFRFGHNMLENSSKLFVCVSAHVQTAVHRTHPTHCTLLLSPCSTVLTTKWRTMEA